jgi:ubiquitin carboxyl-terminal hydrolase 5/13
MTELNLEANLSLTLSKVLEEGKTLIPVFGAGLTGMVNLGNTCYMNAVVQVLFTMPEFKEYFDTRAEDHLRTCRSMASNCYLCQFSKLARGLYGGEFSKAVLAEKTA